ncbi:hypothetical protein U1Q18_007891 [Sarracenia purpurea var. burkii]
MCKVCGVQKERTLSPIEDMKSFKVGTHGKTSDVLIALEHFLVRVAWVKEYPESGEQQHGRRQLIVPTQHAQVRNHIKRLGVLRQPRVSRQGYVAVVSGGVVQPRAAPHVLVVVARGVVVWIDVRVAATVGAPPPGVPGEGKHGCCALDQLRRVRFVVPKHDRCGRQGGRHFSG